MLIGPAWRWASRARRIRATALQLCHALELSAEAPHAPANTRVPRAPRRGDEGDNEEEQEAEPLHGRQYSKHPAEPCKAQPAPLA